MTATTTTPTTLEALYAGVDVVVVCGSGGVGKTSTAAATAVMAAVHSDRRVLVITIDPARRLADAFGVDHLGNAVAPIDLDLTCNASTSTNAKGQLWAAMVDTKQSWDDLVRRHAPDPQTCQRILANPLYNSITGRFVQSHDYIAMERLHELHESGHYDLIVVDTPPASHAVDFLDAPARMADFFSSKLLKTLVAPSRSKFLTMTSRPLLQLADRLVGRRFLEDITEFFTLLETMRDGFIERAGEVEQLLASKRTAFVVVTTLETAPEREARRFIDRLAQRQLHLGAVVLNRILPAALLDPETARAANELQANAPSLATRLGLDASAERMFNELADNARRMIALARSEEVLRGQLTTLPAVVATAPWFGDELHDVRGLVRFGESIWK